MTLRREYLCGILLAIEKFVTVHPDFRFLTEEAAGRLPGLCKATRKKIEDSQSEKLSAPVLSSHWLYYASQVSCDLNTDEAKFTPTEALQILRQEIEPSEIVCHRAFRVTLFGYCTLLAEALK